MKVPVFITIIIVEQQKSGLTIMIAAIAAVIRVIIT